MLLVPTGARIVAVEPVGGMRSVLRVRAHGSNVSVVAGVAEALPLADGVADAVTVAQAFHWFRGAALPELHRVLRPGGVLALVWNRRDLTDPVWAAVKDLIDPFREGTPHHEADGWRALFEGTGLFGPLEERRFGNEQALDADGLVDRVGSTSFVASLPDAERSTLLAQVRALAEEHGGRLTLPYATEVHVADRR